MEKNEFLAKLMAKNSSIMNTMNEINIRGFAYNSFSSLYIDDDDDDDSCIAIEDSCPILGTVYDIWIQEYADKEIADEKFALSPVYNIWIDEYEYSNKSLLERFKGLFVGYFRIFI